MESPLKASNTQPVHVGHDKGEQEWICLKVPALKRIIPGLSQMDTAHAVPEMRKIGCRCE